ncbi:putative late blight resistance protein homolog R1A-10 [Salvia miltiorrhiza]|uniref:putative late blight resistance protein homolog R1A-10 n=1 Tax=Salvia miltiorrhiza TaxID=226208 RepID=UPI0025AC711F|nr:putative late blight resistance protein homolog R1A-10 [Salvia miltiorrhiza]
MAYALIVSLKQTLEPLVDSVGSRIQIPNPELKIIYDDLCYLKSFFDKLNSLEDSNSVEELDKQIKDVLERSQDLIEFHLSDLVHSGSGSSISGFSRELVEVKEKVGSLVNMSKAKEDYLTQPQPSPPSLGWNSKIVGLTDVDVKSRNHFGRNKEIVGLEEEKMTLKQRLLRESNDLAVFSIVGMGGIGKTTLAKEVYLDPLIKDHFDTFLFVEIDFEYDFQALLLRLVGQLLYVENEEMSDYELGVTLYKYLFRRRYLIVLDDVWSIEAWDRLRPFFPNNKVGSAIILTTRLYNLARYVCPQENILQMRLLNEEKSWELLCKMAFPDIEQCPLELEEMGMRIVKTLGGLPLAIVTIGKLLSVSQRTAENWRAVAQNMTSPIRESTIPTFLNLSYTQLPQCLKACFLYLGIFPPNYNIPASQLIKLWIAEGFIEPAADKSLEQKAEEYLEDLVSRSLVIVQEVNSIGRIKTCRIHQLLRDLCVNEAQQQKLFHVNEGTTSSRNQRRLGIHSDVVPGVLDSVSRLLRSLVFICPYHQQAIQRFRWLRVFHALSIRYCKFPDEVLKLVRLRYLAITYDGEELPSSISRLWNLEVLIIHKSQSIKSSVLLPLEIWKLHKLRHLQCMGFDLPDPSMEDATDFLFFGKLLTLSGVSARSCINGVLARMPNLIKLGIWLEPTTTEYAIETFCFDAIFTHLRRLESFKCTPMNRSEAAFSLTGFPPLCLRKLSLSGCGFVWGEHMPIIAQLPFLQVLKLRWHAFCGHEWESYEGGLMHLKVLVLEDLDIKQLMVAGYVFPTLEQLIFRRCYNLEEIPPEFGDIPTLQLIEVDDCSMSLIESAKRIQEEQQEEYGNYDLQVRICSSSHGQVKKFTNSNIARHVDFPTISTT